MRLGVAGPQDAPLHNGAFDPDERALGVGVQVSRNAAGLDEAGGERMRRTVTIWLSFGAPLMILLAVLASQQRQAVIGSRPCLRCWWVQD